MPLRAFGRSSNALAPDAVLDIIVSDERLPEHSRQPFDWRYHMAKDTSRIREAPGFREPVVRHEAIETSVWWERSQVDAHARARARYLAEGTFEGREESMAKRTSPPASIDEYIATSPPAVRPILKEIRRSISTAAPEAEELISYRMPAFHLHGILVYFAVFKNHIGFYPPVSGDASLEKVLAPYAGPKGNLKFPLDRPIPYALIKRVVMLRVRQNLSRVPATVRETKGRGTGRAQSNKPQGQTGAARRGRARSRGRRPGGARS